MRAPVSMLKNFGARSAVWLALAFVATGGIAQAQTLSISDGASVSCDGGSNSVTVSVSLSGVNNASAFGGKLAYDATNLSYVSAAPGAATGNWAAVSGNETVAGSVTFGGFRGAGTVVTGDDQEIIQVTFTCDVCPSITTITATNLTDAAAGATVVDGTVQCGEFPELVIGSAMASDCGGASAIAIPLTFNNASNASAFGGKFNFDAANLTFVSATSGTATANWAAVSGNNTNPGEITFGGFRGAGTVVNGDDNEIIILNFDCATCPTVTVLSATGLTDALAGAQVTNGTATCGEFPQVTVGSASSQCGAGNVAIPITMDNAAAVSAFGATLTYDPTSVTFVSAAAGAATANWAAVSANENAPGTITLGGFRGAGTVVNDDGNEMMVLQFSCNACNVGEDSTTALTLSNTTDGWATAQLTAGSLECLSEDTTDPVAVCQDVTVQLGPLGMATVTAAEVDNGSSDDTTTAANLVLALSQTAFDCSSVGTNPVTLTVTDEAGNSAQCAATVTVVDSALPTVTTQNITRNLSATGPGAVSITAQDVIAGAADNCGIASSSVTPSSFNCGNVGPNTVTVTVMDPSGNMAQATATVTIVDNTNPTVTCPAPVTLDLNATCQATVPDLTGANATDNCGIATVTQSPTAGTVITANTVVTITATDVNGNTATCNVSITVQDVTDPVIDCPVDVTLDLDESCSATVPDLVSGATATDNCGTATVTQDPAAGTAITANTVVVLTATDASGNTETCTVNVNVQDVTDPVLDPVADVALDLGNDCSATVPDLASGATATDNCGTATVTQDPAAGTIITENTVVTLTATDAAGNTATRVANVTVADNTDPAIALLGDATVDLTCGMVFSDAGAAATDNCDGDLTANIVVGDTVDTTTPGTYSVVYTVSDTAGNSASVTRTVNVIADTEAPVITLAGNDPEQFDCGAAVVDPGATATDNCDANVTVTSDYLTVVSTEAQRTFTVSYTTTDSAGNTTQEFRTVIVGPTNCPGIDDGPDGEVEPAVCEDNDTNGYSDNPFACVAPTSITIDTGSGQRTVSQVTWFADDGTDGNVQIAVPVPTDDKQGQTVTASIPRNVLFPGEQGVLIVAVAENLAALLDDATDAATLQAALPANVVSDTPYAEVSVLVSSNGGASFDEIEDFVTDIAQPSAAWIQFSGITLDDETNAVLNSYPTDVTSNPISGITVAGATSGDVDWDNDGNETIQQTADSIRVRVSSLSAFAAFQGPPVPTIATVPSADFDYVVGIVQVGKTQGGNTIRVTNTGTGVVTGTASLTTNPANVFSLVGTTAYSLESGQSATIELAFTPAAEVAYTGVLSLSGGDNGPLSINVLGSGTTVVKGGHFGCGPTTGVTGSGLGDLSFVALVLLALVAASRMFRSTRQNG